MQIMFADLSRTFSTLVSSPYTLGQIYEKPNGQRYRFVKGGGTIAQYEYLTVSKDGLFTVSSADSDTHPLTTCVWEAACADQVALTSSLYGWVFIGGGAHTGLFALNCALNVKLFATSTAGVIDDAATISCLTGVSLIATITTATSAPAWCAIPQMYFDGRTA